MSKILDIAKKNDKVDIDYINVDSFNLDEQGLMQCFMGLATANHLNLCVYTTHNNINTINIFDIAFDFQDSNGNRILPFTKEQPFIYGQWGIHIFSNIIENFDKIVSFKAGFLSTTELRAEYLFKKHFYYNFGKLLVTIGNTYFINYQKDIIYTPNDNLKDRRINLIKKRLNYLENEFSKYP